MDMSCFELPKMIPLPKLLDRLSFHFIRPIYRTCQSFLELLASFMLCFEGLVVEQRSMSHFEL
jgi:hypothetical protein